MSEPYRHPRGRVVPMPLTNIDTDQIIPAAYLKVVDRDGLAQGLFAGRRYLPDGAPKSDFVLHRELYRGAEILFAGDNFGCGSSREHAVWALKAWGFRAVVSTRFGDIFRSNCGKSGLLAATVSPADAERLAARLATEPAAEIEIDLTAQRILLAGDDGLSFDIDPFARHCLLEGVDPLGYLVRRLPAIEAWEAGRRPPVSTLSPAPLLGESR